MHAEKNILFFHRHVPDTWSHQKRTFRWRMVVREFFQKKEERFAAFQVPGVARCIIMFHENDKSNNISTKLESLLWNLNKPMLQSIYLLFYWSIHDQGSYRYSGRKSIIYLYIIIYIGVTYPIEIYNKFTTHRMVEKVTINIYFDRFFRTRFLKGFILKYWGRNEW